MSGYQLLSQEKLLEIIKIYIASNDINIEEILMKTLFEIIDLNTENFEAVRLLLQDNRVDPSADNNYAIRKASENGHTEIVKLLLQDYRVNPADVNNYAICSTSLNGHTEIVKLLLQDNRVNSSNLNGVIVWASGKNHTEIVKLLIPFIDISKIKNEKIINLFKEINKEKTKVIKMDNTDTVENLNNNITEKELNELRKLMNNKIMIKIILDDQQTKLTNNYHITKILLDKNNKISLKLTVSNTNNVI